MPRDITTQALQDILMNCGWKSKSQEQWSKLILLSAHAITHFWCSVTLLFLHLNGDWPVSYKLVIM